MGPTTFPDPSPILLRRSLVKWHRPRRENTARATSYGRPLQGTAGAAFGACGAGWAGAWAGASAGFAGGCAGAT